MGSTTLPQWARQIIDDPAWRDLAKPDNRDVNWVHSNLEGQGLGADYYVNESQARLKGIVVFGERTQGPPGLAHGGAIASLMDDALGTTAWMAGHRVTSLSIKVDFRKYAKLGVPLRIDGRVDRVEGRKVFVRCELLEPPGRLLAEGEGIFLQLEDGRYE